MPKNGILVTMGGFMYYPLKFKPVYKDYIWGGRYFEKFDRQLPEGIIAESWELSCHENGVSVVVNGELAGKSLPEIVKADPQNILGKSFTTDCQEYPLLVKLIDANDKLSVQVHPDDTYAAIYENGRGKNEMWYVVDCKPGAKLVVGLKPGVTKKVFFQAINDNRIEECLNEVEVQSGDVINIPAGTLHAIGAGIVIVEIQQTSDITYRVFDYNRVDRNGVGRQLHLDKALEVTNFNAGSQEVKSKGIKIKLGEGSSKTIYTANEIFGCEKYEVNGSVSETTDGSNYYIYICLSGHGKLKTENMSVEFKAGETVFIPASMGIYGLEGQFSALKAYVPELNKDIVEPMRKAGSADA